ncbi:MAG: FtsX-like permease family protein [Pseudomonadota bacterium]
MNLATLLRIALRNTFAWGKGYLSSFLSSLSMAGLVLAISLLITVLSVMNGFDKEMRERILGLVPHITIYSHLPMRDWRDVMAQLASDEQVESVAPFVEFDSLFMRGSTIETARAIGLALVDEEGGELRQARLLQLLPEDELRAFIADPRGLALGQGLAGRLGVVPGDTVTLIAPAEGNALSARAARFETLTLRAVLRTDTELDQSAAFLALPAAAELAAMGDAVSGLRVTTRDLFAVSDTAWHLLNSLPPGYYSTTWMMTHGNLYAAIQLSRDLVTILLLSIIAVAAFNVVSSLVLVVFDKRGGIAILRTLGAAPRHIALVFLLQGGLIGLVGVVLGTLFGVGLSLSVPQAVAYLEEWLGFRFLNTDVYPVSFLPVDILPRDIAVVAGAAFIMCLLAAIYPAVRAARLAPAAVLQSERS